MVKTEALKEVLIPMTKTPRENAVELRKKFPEAPYEDDVKEQYAANPKVVQTARAESFSSEYCEKYYLCESSQLKMDVAVFGDFWVRRALANH